MKNEQGKRTRNRMKITKVFDIVLIAVIIILAIGFIFFLSANPNKSPSENLNNDLGISTIKSYNFTAINGTTYHVNLNISGNRWCIQSIDTLQGWGLVQPQLSMVVEQYNTQNERLLAICNQ